MIIFLPISLNIYVLDGQKNRLIKTIMFWLRNKKNNFLECTLIWRPGEALTSTGTRMLKNNKNLHWMVG